MVRKLPKKKSEEIKSEHIFEVMNAIYSTREYYSDNGTLGPGYSSWVTGTAEQVSFEVKGKDNIKYLEIIGNVRGIEIGDLIKTYVKRKSWEKIGEKLTNKNISKIEKISKEGNVKAVFEIDSDLK